MIERHTIWRGPLLGNQRQILLDEVIEYIHRSGQRQPGQRPAVIYLVASRPMLTAISLEILSRQTVPGVFGELPVYLFNGFIRRLLRTAQVLHQDGVWRNVPYRRDISSEDYPLRRPLIAQLMRQLARQGQLPAFGDLATTRGCVASVARLIGEITRAGKTAAEFEQIVQSRIAQMAESLPASTPEAAERLYGYELDVARVMQCYAAALNGGHPLRHQRNADVPAPAALSASANTSNAALFTENDTDYLRAIAALDGNLNGLPCQTTLLDGVEWLIVDGFFDLTPVQGEILRRLVKRVPRVTFNFDDDADNPPVFASVHETIAKIREMMGELVQEVIFHERHGTCRVTRLERAAGLEVLSQGLFNPAFQPPAKTTAPVFLAVAPDIERELRHIAKTIKHYVHEKRLSPAKIAIVLRDRDTYGAHLRRVLSDEGIAYTFDERLPVTDIPAVRAWVKLVAAAAARPPGKTEASKIPVSRLLDILKSDYFTLPQQPMSADDIENVVAFVGEQLHLADWLERAEHLANTLQPTKDDSLPLAAVEGATDSEAEESHNLAADEPTVRPDAVTATQLREASTSLQQLDQILAEIPTEGAADAFCRAVEKALATLAYEQQIVARIQETVGRPWQRLQATLDLRGVQVIRRAVVAVADAERLATQSITATLNQLSIAGGDRSPNLSLSVWLADVLQALDELTLRVEPEMFGAVRILEATTIRGLHFPVIFVPGMVEGGFPPRLPGDWLYPPAERERLKEHGLILEDISPATLVKEEHYFYQVVCRATQAVHLSYPTVGAEDQELVPSSFLAEIQRLVPATAPGGQHHIVISKGYDGTTLLQATSRSELVRQAVAVAAEIKRKRQGEIRLAEPAWERKHGQVLSPSETLSVVQDYLTQQSWLSDTLRQRQVTEDDRYGPEWTPFDGRITDSNLQLSLSQHFGEQYIFSATALNEYGACPFRFFARRVLKLRPRVNRALDLQALERGQILHDILRDFYRTIENRKSVEEKPTDLKDIAKKIFDQHEEKFLPLNKKIWEIEKRILLTYLEQLVTEGVPYKNKSMQHITELAFGMYSPKADHRSVASHLELTNEKEKKIFLRGQIDRIDIIEIEIDGNKQQFSIIYDYKLSNGKSVRDMLRGLDVQIAIYLTATNKIFHTIPKPVLGGGYYSITKIPRFSNVLILSKYKDILEENHKYNLIEEESIREIMGYVWEYQDQMKNGNFQVRPQRGIQECQFCDFRSVCRYETHRIQRKQRRFT